MASEGDAAAVAPELTIGMEGLALEPREQPAESEQCGLPDWHAQLTIMVEKNRKQRDFIKRLLKEDGVAKAGSMPKVPYPQKWKPHDSRPMDRFLNEVELWFLDVGVKDDYTRICQVATFLEGGAKDWLLAIRKANPSGIEKIWTWVQMKKEMCE